MIAFQLNAQEPQPRLAIRYSPLHLAYQDPTVQFQLEKFRTPQHSWTASLGLGHETLFKDRNIQGTLQTKLGVKKYLKPFSTEKKNNFFLGLEGMYRYSLERQTGFFAMQDNSSFDFKLRLHAVAGHLMMGWTLLNPHAPSLDFYFGAGVRHVRGKNIGIDPNLMFEQKITLSTRNSRNITYFSPLLGICIGISHWK